MKPFILLGLLLTLPAVGFAETRVYRSYSRPVERSATVRVAPSYEVYRSWDRHRDYRWNEHRYHWDGTAWIIAPDVYYGGGFGTSSTLQDDVGSAPVEDVYVPRTVTRTVTRVEAPSSTLAIDVQRRLARRGYYHGPIDGVVGPGTRSAIAGFQADHGLDPSGLMSDETLGRLGL